MPSHVNGSEFIDNPFDTVMNTFTGLIGGVFWLIPIGVIAVALYIKTREVTASAVWIMASCSLVGTVVFNEHPEVGFLYYIFVVIGLMTSIISIFFMRK